ncbi:MAG: hypothetical protein H6818_19525 [Phycisphaerales bacterium]|nr:hypothetical protein [Phycisphaerales bacterium]MCB9863657.1 hypothetical protein [Phycisphaerales bacterium]
MSRRIRSLALRAASIAVFVCTVNVAIAKERHLEQLRVALISRTARCATCHTSNDKKDWEGAGLNIYGKRLSEVSPGDALADRIALLEHGPGSTDAGAEAARKKQDQDIDGDGVPNWVEILARANPADPKNKPAPERIERVERVVTCNICHTQTHLPGKQGLEANPHNAFGLLLSETTRDKKDAASGSGPDRHRAAERVPILKRIELTRKKKPKGGKATYWEKLRLMRLPADDDDNPSKESLMSFRKRAAQQRSKKKRDPTRGMVAPAHNNDGFLQDCTALD